MVGLERVAFCKGHGGEQERVLAGVRLRRRPQPGRTRWYTLRVAVRCRGEQLFPAISDILGDNLCVFQP